MVAFLNLTGVRRTGRGVPNDHKVHPVHSVNVEKIDELYEGMHKSGSSDSALYTPIVGVGIHIEGNENIYYLVEAGPTVVRFTDKAEEGRTLTAKELGEKIQRISEGAAQDFVCKCICDDEDDSEDE